LNWKEKSAWNGTGTFVGIPVNEVLTGGECIFCYAKRTGDPLEKILIDYEKIISGDKYALYSKPNILELEKFQRDMNLL